MRSLAFLLFAVGANAQGAIIQRKWPGNPLCNTNNFTTTSLPASENCFSPRQVGSVGSPQSFSYNCNSNGAPSEKKIWQNADCTNPGGSTSGGSSCQSGSDFDGYKFFCGTCPRTALMIGAPGTNSQLTPAGLTWYSDSTCKTVVGTPLTNVSNTCINVNATASISMFCTKSGSGHFSSASCIVYNFDVPDCCWDDVGFPDSVYSMDCVQAGDKWYKLQIVGASPATRSTFSLFASLSAVAGVFALLFA